jgi:hypothetical protein
MVSINPPLFAVVVTGIIADWKPLAVLLRQENPDLTSAAARALVQNLPLKFRDGLEREAAFNLARKLRAAQGVVEVRDADGQYVYEHYLEVDPQRQPKPYPG